MISSQCHHLEEERLPGRGAMNLVPLLDHLDEGLPLAVEVLVRHGRQLSVDLRVGGHPDPEPVIGDQVMVAFFEGGYHVEGDHFPGQVINVADAEIDPHSPPVGAHPGVAVVGGESLPYLLKDLPGVHAQVGGIPQDDHDVDIA